MNGCCSQQVLRQNLGWLILTLENTFLKGFILNPTQRASILLKNGTRDFQNSPSFETSTCFYVTITTYFERFQYFNFETDFLENESLSQKSGLPLFS